MNWIQFKSCLLNDILWHSDCLKGKHRKTSYVIYCVPPSRDLNDNEMQQQCCHSESNERTQLPINSVVLYDADISQGKSCLVWPHLQLGQNSSRLTVLWARQAVNIPLSFSSQREARVSGGVQQPGVSMFPVVLLLLPPRPPTPSSSMVSLLFLGPTVFWSCTDV